jgi:diketogulonate reductase-like aldo/keto reductase
LNQVYNTVLWYLLQGGRHIDTAQLYLNHRPIGAAIKEAMQRGVSRDEIFVTTKIEGGTFGTNNTAAWIPQMLEELQLDYVDLVPPPRCVKHLQDTFQCREHLLITRPA